MQVVALISHPELLGDAIKLAQRIYKTGHEALNLPLIHMHNHFVLRKEEQWEQTYQHLVSLADAVIIFAGMEHFNRLTSHCMQHNIPVFSSFEEWYNSLPD